MKKFFLAITLAFSIGIYFLLENNQSKKNISTLVMGVSLDYHPFEFIDKDNNPSGYDIDLAYMLAKDIGFELEIRDLDFNSLIPSLNTNQIDFVISSMSPTEVRAKNVDFSDIYYKASMKLITLRDIGNKFDFAHKTVGVQFGSTMETYAQSKQKTFTSLKILSLARIPHLVEELKLGRIDAVLVDEQVANKILATNSDMHNIDVLDYDGSNAIAFKKGSKLTKKFNMSLNNLHDKGKLKELEDKWMKNLSISDDDVR